jgi:hypothetical protein
MSSVTLFTFLVYTIDRSGTKLEIISVLRLRTLNTQKALCGWDRGSDQSGLEEEDTPASKTDGGERR